MEEKNPDKDIYSTEYYDKTGKFETLKMLGYVINIGSHPFPEFETILTSVELEKFEKKKFKLPKEELERVERLLKRSRDKESGKLNPEDISEDNPDGCESFQLFLFLKEALINIILIFFFSLSSGHFHVQGRGPAQGDREEEAKRGARGRQGRGGRPQGQIQAQ